MNRRRFVALIGGTVAVPVIALAQRPRKIYRIGWPSLAPRSTLEPFVAALEQGLRDHGYVPGKDVVFEIHSAEERIERLAEVVQSVVRSRPDVIVTSLNPTTAAVKTATQTIPIVMTLGTDVVGTGFARSLAKPGGNITGLTWDVGTELPAKRLELLKEIVPRISRVAVLWAPPYKGQFQSSIDNAAAVLGLTTFWLELSDDLERDFAEMVRQRADAVVLSAAGLRRTEFYALAAKHRLPTAGGVSESVQAGALISYGPNIAAAYRAAARYIDKIFKGAKPGDLPVEQPTKIDLVINLKTAKALGITIPQQVLLRADRVIE